MRENIKHKCLRWCKTFDVLDYVIVQTVYRKCLRCLITAWLSSRRCARKSALSFSLFSLIHQNLFWMLLHSSLSGTRNFIDWILREKLLKSKVVALCLCVKSSKHFFFLFFCCCSSSIVHVMLQGETFWIC